MAGARDRDWSGRSLVSEGLLLLIAVGMLQACSADPAPTEVTGIDTGAAESSEVGQVQDELYVYANRIWDSSTLSVCWNDTSVANSAERSWVRGIVESEFESISNIDFTWWGPCDGKVRDIVIAVGETEWPRAAAGKRTPSAAPSVWFNFFKTAPSDLDNEDGDDDPLTGVDFATCYGTSGYDGETGRTWDSRRRWCIETAAVHEFAHVMAIAHEQGRDDTPEGCSRRAGPTGQTPYGYWDITSISNYCNPVWNNDGRLSMLDVAGLQTYYGSTPTEHLYWGLGDVRDYTWEQDFPQLAFEVKEKPVSGTDYVPVVGDFNGDRQDDIFWYRPGTGGDSIWFFARDKTHTSQSVTMSGTYVPIAGNFNGDRFTDIFWYQSGGSSVIWFFGEGGTWTVQNETPGAGYRPFSGDFNGDGRADIFWYRPGTKSDAIWFFNEDKTHSVQQENVDGDYQPIVGRFSTDDSAADVLWYRPGTASDSFWYFTTGGSHTSLPITINNTYSTAVGDFNDDYRADILWYRPGEASDFVWLMGHEAGEFEQMHFRYDGTGIPLVGDFNGDRLADVFFYMPE